jgi:hypothetical protein
MPCHRLSCVLIISAGLAAGCATSARLADAPATGPAAPGVTPNRPPTAKIEGGSAQPVAPGSRLSLQANVYDPDGDAVTLEWTTTAGVLSGATTARTNWTAPAAATTLTITLRATDSSGASASDTLSLQVLAK